MSAGNLISLIPFNPNGGVNFSIYGVLPLAVSQASNSGAFTSANSIGASSVIVINATTVTIFVAFGLAANGTVSASVPVNGTESSNSQPVLSGMAAILIKGTANDTCAVIGPTGSSGEVYFCAGEGA